MFWNYTEWRIAFFIQIIGIIIAFIFGKKLKVNNFYIFFAIALVSPVALFNISSGVAGSVFLSDIAALLITLKNRRNLFTNKKISFLTILLFVIWPISSTIFSILYSPFSNNLDFWNPQVFALQCTRYFLFAFLLISLTSQITLKLKDLQNIFKVQSVLILFVFTSILLGYFGILKVDAWNELIGITFDDSNLGKGGMFLYRGGVGTFGAISIPIIFYLYINARGLYKYLLSILIFIILCCILFSGSRQGISIAIISIIASLIVFKKSGKTSQVFVLGAILILLALQSESFLKTSEWVLGRYEILISDDVDIKSEVYDRNYSLVGNINKTSDLVNDIIGHGMGVEINSTESDFYNTYLYFGFVGLAIYLYFILYCMYKAYINWKKTKIIQEKNIFSIPLLTSILIPLFGFQQWYIMTFGSSNSMNVYLILFILSIVLQSENWSKSNTDIIS